MPASTRYFTVTVPQGMSTIKLDSKGSATCQITVKNASRAVIDGRAVLVSLPPATKDAAGVVEKNWVKIDGTTDRHFAVDQEEVFSIKIALPQKKGEVAPAGSYSFRMDVINTARPDDSGDQSQALGFTVAAAAAPAKSKWPLIAVIAALVLIVGGVTTWLLMRNSGSSSPSTDTSTPGASPTPATKGTPAPPASPWAGTWLNDNPGTNTVTKLVITQEGSVVSVHAWGKCSPTDCDWGPRPGGMNGNIVTAVWNQGTNIHTLNLRPASANHLMMGFSSVLNGRPGASSSETFHR